MSEEQVDRLDALASKILKEIPQEKPSVNFLKNVMDEINALEVKRELNKNQPLISKRGWLLIVALIITSTILLGNIVSFSNESFFSKINFNKYTDAISLDIPMNFTVSNVTIYGFLFLAIMVTVQIGYIKNYYNSRFN